LRHRFFHYDQFHNVAKAIQSRVACTRQELVTIMCKIA
jgi:hypothetical protein